MWLDRQRGTDEAVALGEVDELADPTGIRSGIELDVEGAVDVREA
jgi:hypothetical protein